MKGSRCARCRTTIARASARITGNHSDRKSRCAAMPGIGPKRAAALEARGIVTAGDLIFHLPVRYQDWRERSSAKDLRVGNIVVVEGELGKISERPMRGSRWRRLASGWLNVGGRQIRVVWFNLPAYMRGYLPGGERVLVRGRVAAGTDGGIEIVQPELHRLSDGEPKAIRPVYRLPSIVGQRLFAGSGRARARRDWRFDSRMQFRTKSAATYLTVREALSYLHDPPPDADFDALANGDSRGHLALAFDELFAFELALSIERLRGARRVGIALDGSQSLSAKMLEELPFALTGSQSRAIDEIAADLARPNQMNRMLMGDVGSGKTIVAFWAMIRAIECGHQAAMMAPTELLAEQHWRGFARMCGRLGRQARAAHRERDGCGAQPDFARTCERRNPCGVRNACADSGAGADARTRARRDRRAASLRRFRSREDESIGAEGESADDDGDADSAKPGDEPVRESRRVVSRRVAGGTHADRDRDLHRRRYRAGA